jgi:hypothetical protein
LEDKVEGVNKMFEELDGKIENLSRECLYLKQRLMEEIPEITEKARKKLMVHCTSNFYRKSKLYFLIFRKQWRGSNLLSSAHMFQMLDHQL